MKIILGADHGGFELKEQIKSLLLNEGYEIEDAGNLVYDATDDYPDFAISVAKKIGNNETNKGIIICGSGVGACIAANKIKGVRASVCHDTYSAKQGVTHDNMNVLCLGGRIIGIEVAKELVLGFASATFSNEERHKRRLAKVVALEN
jgi:ribose 5-phosphate isomerase B